MPSSSKLLPLAAAALISSVTSASPLQPNGANPSSAMPSNSVNCSDVSTGLAPDCWFNLNMTDYLNDWVANSPYTNAVTAENSSTSTNTSDTSGNPFTAGDVTVGNFSDGTSFRRRAVAQPAAAAAPASRECQGGKPFSTCFLQLQQGYKAGKTDCSKISYAGANGTCPAPRAEDYSNEPKAFYALWNFYSINAYISTLYSALPTLAKSHPTVLSTAATEGSPGLPYFHSSTQMLSVDIPLLNLLIQSTGGHELPGGQNTPFLTLLELAPAPSTATYGVSTSITELAALMQDRLSQVLGKVMADERLFVGVVGNGAFSTSTGLGSVEGWVKALGG